MVMAMFGALNRSGGGAAFDGAEAIENEDVLAGNLCRCTGYRPLNAALKSFARGTEQKDHIGNVSRGTTFGPYDSAGVDPTPVDMTTVPALAAPFRPTTLDALVAAFVASGPDTLVVAGHTGHGVYGEDLRSMFREEADVLHIRGVRALHAITSTNTKNNASTELRVGAAATIAQFIDVLGANKALAKNNVAVALREHASLIAGHQIRNVGSVGGNVMMCRDRGFASDLATILCGVDAHVEYVTRGQTNDTVQSASLHTFLTAADRAAALLLAITISIPNDNNVIFRTYRTALRSRNAYSQCNAAFFLVIAEDGKVATARVVYGALGNGRRPFLAQQSAAAVTGKTLAQFSGAFVAFLKAEVAPIVAEPPESRGDGHGEFRARLVTAFATKFVALFQPHESFPDAIRALSLRPTTPTLHGKGTRASQAVQRFDTYEGSPYAPAFQPTPKTSGLAQTTGAIKYTADAFPHGTLFGAYISAPFHGAVYQDLTVSSDDTASPAVHRAIADALAMGHVIGYQHVEGAGFETVLPWGQAFATFGGPSPTKEDGSDPANDEHLFLPPLTPAGYHGQPVAIVLCKTQLLAERVAAEMTKSIRWSGGVGRHGGSSTVGSGRACGKSSGESKSSTTAAATPSTPLLSCTPAAAAADTSVPPSTALFTLQAAPSFDATQMCVLTNRNGEVDQLKALLSDDSLLLLEGRFDKRSQQHFYMETQRTLTVPGDDKVLTCFTSAQGMNNTHKVISHMLNKRWSEIVVKLRRVGGGFGGKLSRGVPNAVRSAACAAISGRPVLLVLTRENDMAQVGGREEMGASWRAAVDRATGEIKAIDVQMLFGAGYTLADSRFNAGMFGADFDSVYEIKQAQCTTHVKQGFAPARTAVRTPIHLETVLFMESVMDKIALELGKDFAEIRETNFVGHGFLKQLGVKPIGRQALAPGPMTQWSLRPVWDAVKSSADYAGKVAAARAFNAQSEEQGGHMRRGVGIAPGKYTCYRAIHTGIRVRVNILDDGSIQVHSGGAEIGQGLLTKVGQCVCATLTEQLRLSQPLDLDLVRFREFDSGHNPNQGNAGGSTTSEAAVHAAEKACKELAARLKPWKKGSDDWLEIVKNAKIGVVGGITAFAFKVDFDVAGFYLPPFDEAFYPVFGASVAEVQIDTLTGETKVLSSHIVMDSGKSLNPAIDIGQVEGAYVMGLGQLLLEKVVYDEADGSLKTDNTWTYKPPGINDIPENFTVELLDFERDRVNNGFGAVFPCLRRVLKCCGPLKNPTMGAKRYRSNRAMGEPPMMTVTAVGSALRQAIVAGRGGDNAFDVPVPCTPEDVSSLCAHV
jgi:xanthine dehydrogenase molybdopterin-binding subunit B/xanthine dehydrogenase iron-sulfur cluster and FAD-binding subunit A